MYMYKYFHHISCLDNIHVPHVCYIIIASNEHRSFKHFVSLAHLSGQNTTHYATKY